MPRGKIYKRLIQKFGQFSVRFALHIREIKIHFRSQNKQGDGMSGEIAILKLFIFIQMEPF